MHDAYPQVAASDPEVHAALVGELRRQEEQIELIASENHASPAVLEALGSVLTNKYAEGYPGKRYYGGCEWVDRAEVLAQERLRTLFRAEHANVQPSSGSQANQAALLAMAEPGATVLAMELNHGGHLSHGHPKNSSGIYYKFVHYGVRADDERIDYEAVARLAAEHKPRVLMAGASAYPRVIDFERMRAIATDAGAGFLVDMAHIAGLVAAGVHPSPVPHADVVTTTTHKTLRGPRGGAIVCKEAWAKKIDSAVFPGMQGGPLMHAIAAKAVCLKEALEPSFKTYQQQIVNNAKALAAGLTKRGYRLVSGGTDTHLMLVDLRGPKGPGVTGKTAEDALHHGGITVNKNLIPFDPEKPMQASGIRIGTPAVTTRGFDTRDMEALAGWIDQILRAPADAAVAARVRQETLELCRRRPIYSVLAQRPAPAGAALR
ncbi:MAG: serine hydroxymethyltransferase [Planctomycetota bacterium]|nr:MAG: serine hydroxymethyltransferase [Planctomycetota bacterium]